MIVIWSVFLLSCSQIQEEFAVNSDSFFEQEASEIIGKCQSQQETPPSINGQQVLLTGIFNTPSPVAKLLVVLLQIDRVGKSSDPHLTHQIRISGYLQPYPILLEATCESNQISLSIPKNLGRIMVVVFSDDNANGPSPDDIQGISTAVNVQENDIDLGLIKVYPRPIEFFQFEDNPD